jgi:arginase family enzyme
LLHLDEALMAQHRLRRAVCDAGGRLLDYRDLGPGLRLWSRPRQVDRLRRRLAAALPPSFGPMLVVSGSGDFHHITLLLLERAAEAAAAPVTLLHFDNHPDWVRFRSGVHCGSWVSDAARLPQVAKVITVGVCSGDVDEPDSRSANHDTVAAGRLEIYPYRTPQSGPCLCVGDQAWPTIETMGEAAFADFLPRRIETEAVYVTIDKDVLRAEEAGTNWDQGQTSLALLKTLVGRACEGRRVIGADIVGDWSKPVYGGALLAPLLKQGEAILDQPWRAPQPERLEGNEAVNLELFELFQELAQ